MCFFQQVYILSVPFVPGTVELHFRVTGPDVVFRHHLGSQAVVKALGTEPCPYIAYSISRKADN